MGSCRGIGPVARRGSSIVRLETGLYDVSILSRPNGRNAPAGLTFFGALKADIKFLPVPCKSSILSWNVMGGAYTINYQRCRLIVAAPPMRGRRQRLTIVIDQSNLIVAHKPIPKRQYSRGVCRFTGQVRTSCEYVSRCAKASVVWAVVAKTVGQRRRIYFITLSYKVSEGHTIALHHANSHQSLSSSGGCSSWRSISAHRHPQLVIVLTCVYGLGGYIFWLFHSFLRPGSYCSSPPCSSEPSLPRSQCSDGVVMRPKNASIWLRWKASFR